jgi:hypothetical protein
MTFTDQRWEVCPPHLMRLCGQDACPQWAVWVTIHHIPELDGQWWKTFFCDDHARQWAERYKQPQPDLGRGT